MTANSIRLRALVLPVALALVFLLLLAQGVYAGNSVVPTDSYRVVGGDTLWDIAEGRTDDGGDVRATVRTIQRLNDLDGGLILPGQLLTVPAA